MADIIVTIILLIVLSLAVCYIIVAKKKGEGCIGCPNASRCGGKCSGHFSNLYDCKAGGNEDAYGK